jgi:hypothetical protein
MNTEKTGNEIGYYAHIYAKADKASDCILVINPAEPTQNAERLKATLKAINEEFLSCKIFLADSIYHHFCNSTLLAKKKADEWLSSHEAILSQYNYDIIRWDSVREHETFDARYENVKLLREFDKDGRKIIHMACAKSAVRHLKELDKIGRPYNEKAIMNKIINYSLEEIAGLAVIKEICPHPEIYAHERYGDPHVFGRLNASYIDADLTLPTQYQIKFYAADGSNENMNKEDIFSIAS